MNNTMKDYSNKITPTWCPGCGHFSILRAIEIAASKLEISIDNFTSVTGIGCSGRLSGYLNGYSFHSIHGRALPIAQGIKMANRDLVVIAAGGDGDGFAIGTNHTLHAIRRNLNITYIVLNNQIYGLTKGHTSPLSELGLETKSTPFGSISDPLKPGITALAAGVTYLAQGFSGFQDQLINIIVQGIKHNGFSLINVFSPCVTFNKVNTYQWYRKNIENIEEDSSYDSSNYKTAMNKLIETDGLCTGIIYKKNEASFLDKLQGDKAKPLIKLDLNISQNEFESLLNQFK